MIRLTTVQPRKRGRGIETPEQAAERGKFDLALVAVLSDAGLRRSEASSLTWGDIVRWEDGSGRITVIRSKTDVEAQGAVVAITPAAIAALDAIRPVGVAGDEKVFGLSESQIARRVKVIARAAGLSDWSSSAATADASAWPAAWPRTAPQPTRSNYRAGGSRAAAWSAATPAGNPPGRHCGTCNPIFPTRQLGLSLSISVRAREPQWIEDAVYDRVVMGVEPALADALTGESSASRKPSSKSVYPSRCP